MNQIQRQTCSPNNQDHWAVTAQYLESVSVAIGSHLAVDITKAPAQTPAVHALAVLRYCELAAICSETGAQTTKAAAAAVQQLRIQDLGVAVGEVDNQLLGWLASGEL